MQNNDFFSVKLQENPDFFLVGTVMKKEIAGSTFQQRLQLQHQNGFKSNLVVLKNLGFLETSSQLSNSTCYT